MSIVSILGSRESKGNAVAVSSGWPCMCVCVPSPWLPWIHRELHRHMAEEALESPRLCRNEELSHKIWNLLPIQLFHLIKSKETSKSSLATSDSQFPKERATVLTDLNNSQGLESFCLKKTGGREGGRLFFLTKTSKWPLENSKKRVCPAYTESAEEREPEQRHIPHSFPGFNGFFMPGMMNNMAVSSGLPVTQSAYLQDYTLSAAAAAFYGWYCSVYDLVRND